ncbi:leucine rich repeat domain-containing protein [Ditylenchus destructor]|uniref:Leucine rich repeat domain-containing protein n=1 Tax=Ditylenchus destructor TaxID=166010 RepID=A0AAD4RDU1_9BILA|nr:leucine rich repeat domain-containing protein [Ditylenchus destructor]
MKLVSIPLSFYILILLLLVALDAESDVLNDFLDPCTKIEEAFRAAEPGKPQACHCLPEALGALNHEIISTDSRTNGTWIGCTQQSFTAIFRAMNSLNESIPVSQLWIWNSLLNVIPHNLFSNIQPESLAIENSGTSLFRQGAFSNMKRLKHLRLRNNILKSIESKTFMELDNLKTLDLSGNKLTTLKRGHFDNLVLLETLMLSDNRIQQIEDGTFASLANVKSLNLANNKIANITKGTFAGLVGVEKLNLNSNNISFIEDGAFDHMTKLQHLDLGENQISKVAIKGLPLLKRLYINRNRIKSLENVALKDLKGLSLLNVDRNSIERIADNDLLPLADSPKLVSLSFVENNITDIGCHAMENVRHLAVLSLQQNRISSLSCSPTTIESALVQSIFRSLHELQSLFLSANIITTVEDGDLNVLPKLRNLLLDHNAISRIGRSALKGLKLTNLFLNNNKLYYLPEGVFDTLNVTEIKAVDLSDNPWECICGREWIGRWLNQLGQANMPSGGTHSLGCLAKGCEHTKEIIEEPTDHSLWITIIASILALVALIFLVTASYVYMQSNCYPPTISLRNFCRHCPTLFTRIRIADHATSNFINEQSIFIHLETRKICA